MTYETKATLIAREIRHEILLGKYPIGKRLVPDEIAKRLGVSQTPVREALRILQAEAYIYSVPHHGFTVASPSNDKLSDVFRLRRIIEVFSVELAATRVTGEQLGELEENIRMMRLAVENKDLLIARKIGFQFHEKIAESSGFARLQIVLRVVWSGHPWSYLVLPDLERMAVSVCEHEQIFNALRAGDPNSARMAMDTHIRATEANALKHEQSQPRTDGHIMEQLGRA
jgi:DNA-binding GntR family transcriptional regulator